MTEYQAFSWVSMSVRVPEGAVLRRGSLFSGRGRVLTKRAAEMHNVRDLHKRIAAMLSADTFTLNGLPQAVRGHYGDEATTKMEAAGRYRPYTSHLEVQRTLSQREGSVSNGANDLVYYGLDDADGADHLLDYVLADQTDRTTAEAREISGLSLDLSQVLACRRWGLYAPEFAERTYNIALPGGLLCGEPGAIGFAALPFVFLVREPKSATLRRSINVTVLFHPLDQPDGAPSKVWSRFLDRESLAAPRMSTFASQFELRGDVVAFLRQSALDPGVPLPNTQTLSGWTSLLALAVLRRLTGADEKGDPDIREEVQSAMSVEPVKGFAVLHPTLETVDLWEAWAEDALIRGTGEAAKVPLEALSEMLENFDLPTDGPSRQIVKTSRNNPGPEVLFYFEDRSLLLGTMPRGAEQFPSRSLLRLMSSMVLMGINLASLRTLVFSFHREMELARKSPQLTTLLNNVATDLDEVYDLDLRESGYKFAYNEIKDRTGHVKDLQEVRWSIEVVSNLMSDQETRRTGLATALLTFTIAALTLAIVSQNLRWPAGWELAFATAGIVTAASGVWVILLDPLRGGRTK